MCIHQQDHCAHHWIQISSTLSQQGQSHMDSEQLPTGDPSTGTESLVALELLKKRKHSKNNTVQQAGCIKITPLSHYLFYIIIYISSFSFLIAQYYFHVTVLHFESIVTVIYISFINTYYVLCMCCLFLLLSNLSTM